MNFPRLLCLYLAPHRANVRTTAKIPAHFRFWIFDFGLVSDGEPEIEISACDPLINVS